MWSFILFQINVKNDQDLRLLLNVRDENGRLFDNFTSLYISWSSSDKRLASFVGPSKSVKMMFIREGENEDVRRSVCEYNISLSSFIKE